MESDAFSESSSSNGDSGESEENDEIFEACCFKDNVLQLPECFCDEEDVFGEVISSSAWMSLINKKYAERLKQFLPIFPENDEFEKQDTLRKLFNGDSFRFGSPFKLFFQKLRAGILSSEVVEITNALKEANYKEYKSQQKLYSYKLLHDVLLSRQKLVEASYSLPPENSVKMQQYFPKPKDATLSENAKLRYFSMLQHLREETGEVDTSSDDENYPESCLLKAPKKYKKHLNQENRSNVIVSMSTTSDTLNYSGNGNFHHTNNDAMIVSEDRYRGMLQNHKEKTFLEPKCPELSTTYIELKGVISRCNFPKRASPKPTDGAGKKKAKTSDISDKPNSLGFSDLVESSMSLINIIKEEHNTNSSLSDHITDSISPTVQETEVQTDPLTVLNELEDSEKCENPPAKLHSPRPEVTQYPTCFFSLLRDIFCESSEQKLSAVKLEEKVKTWQGGPTASLFEWMSFQESWSDLVSSALKFLAGDLISILPETFVPFLDYKEKQQQWQWIGSGRDSDEQMFGLCQQWLNSKDDISFDMLETSQGSPPPPRITTGWTVRPTVENEKLAYRQQECVRYQNPHKAFTFKVHGYEAVVGPVKGVYGKESGVNKAREHSLLTSDRPPFVTILSLG